MQKLASPRNPAIRPAVSDLYTYYPVPYDKIGTPVFTAKEDGTVHVDQWYDLVLMSGEFLSWRHKPGNTILVSRDGGSLVTLLPENGVAFYQHIYFYTERMEILFRLVWGELW